MGRRRQHKVKLSPYEAHLASRQCVGQLLNGEMEKVSTEIRPYFQIINLLDGPQRNDGWKLVSAEYPDVLKAIVDADPKAPPDEDTTTLADSFIPATLEDIERIVANQRYLWKGWIPAGVMTCVAAEPGTGKTRFAMDLARRLWHGLPWPDGQINDYPSGTKTLWIQGDRNFSEMLQVARDFGIPLGAVALGASRDDPMGGLDLDSAEGLAALAARVRSGRPAMVVIDTIGMTTSRNLAKPEEAREFYGPLLDMANATETCFVALTHLSKDKDPLGRRIVEKARSVIKMTQPDPDGQPNRRRLWVDKTAVEKPPPLGITMGTEQNQYDSSPPVEPDSFRARGPAPIKTEACERWLATLLTNGPIKLKEIRDMGKTEGFDVKLLYTARDRMSLEEFTEGNRKWWKRPETSDVGDVGDIDY
jgi:KaiC/GvpD/RAD55 family RecA-like ATPase